MPPASTSAAARLLRKLALKFLPPLTWVPAIGTAWPRVVGWDVLAGFTVALTLIPQSLAYAGLAELGKNYGLYSAYIGCLLYFVFGSVKDVQVGPVAIVCLLVGEVVLATPPEDVNVMLATLTLFIGMFQLALVIFRLSFVLDFIGHPVLVGFTNATAITIAGKQVNSLLGISIESSATFLENMIQLIPHLGQTNPWALLVSVLSIFALMVMKRLSVFIPRNAIVVIVFAVVVHYADLETSWNLKIVGDLPSGLPSPQLPDFARFGHLASTAAVIALVGLIEHVAVAKALARISHGRTDVDCELVALGVANTVSSFFLSIPVTGSFSRSTLNNQSGGKTQFASAITGVIALLAILFLSSTFTYIPDATLAAVIILTVMAMMDFHEMYELFFINKLDFLAMILTFVAVLILGAEFGIIIGTIVSIFATFYVMSRPSLKPLPGTGNLVLPVNSSINTPSLFGNSSSSVVTPEDVPSENVLVDVQDEQRAVFFRPLGWTSDMMDSARYEGIVILRVMDNIFFPNAQYIAEQLANMVDASLGKDKALTVIKGIVLDCSLVNYLDETGMVGLMDAFGELKARNVSFGLAGLRGIALDRLEQAIPRLKSFHGTDRVILVFTEADLQALIETTHRTCNQVSSTPHATEIVNETAPLLQRRNTME